MHLEYLKYLKYTFSPKNTPLVLEIIHLKLPIHFMFEVLRRDRLNEYTEGTLSGGGSKDQYYSGIYDPEFYYIDNMNIPISSARARNVGEYAYVLLYGKQLQCKPFNIG